MHIGSLAHGAWSVRASNLSGGVLCAPFCFSLNGLCHSTNYISWNKNGIVKEHTISFSFSFELTSGRPRLNTQTTYWVWVWNSTNYSCRQNDSIRRVVCVVPHQSESVVEHRWFWWRRNWRATATSARKMESYMKRDCGKRWIVIECAVAWPFVVIGLIDCNSKKNRKRISDGRVSYAIPNPNQMRTTINELCG